MKIWNNPYIIIITEYGVLQGAHMGEVSAGVVSTGAPPGPGCRRVLYHSIYIQILLTLGIQHQDHRLRQILLFHLRHNRKDL